MSLYFFSVRKDAFGRIVKKVEVVGGRKLTWTYAYDKAGRLAEAKLDGRLVCQCRYDAKGHRSQDYFPLTGGRQVRNYRYTMDDRLQSAGNNGYTHDKSGFRILWNNGGKYTSYTYAKDGLLLRAEQEDLKALFEFSHDVNGQRVTKHRNGTLVAAYKWLDLIRLVAFHDGRNAFRFFYDDDQRIPHSMARDDGELFRLHYDQVGSLRVVVDSEGNMIKDVLYDPFGGIIEDSNPDFHVPIGFAGGLHDRDLGLVRFGWRDYDTFTGRWTAPDPM